MLQPIRPVDALGQSLLERAIFVCKRAMNIRKLVPSTCALVGHFLAAELLGLFCLHKQHHQ